MAADITNFTSWSTTASSNQPDASDSISNLDDNLQQIQAEVRKYVGTKGADIASGATVDLSTATGNYVHITGVTTITALGTVAAGIRMLLVFDGILTFTHNGTSLILPGAANITTAAGDRCEVVSLGSGNWRCLWYQKASGAPVGGSYQPLDATLTALAGTLTAANKIPYATALDTAGELDLSTSTSLGASNTTLSTQGAVKSYVDTADALKAPLASPTFTGVPAAPTAVTTTNTTQLATTAFVQQELGTLSVEGMTLLGTLNTTSGTTQTLSGLTLTDYKMLVMTMWNVASNGGNPLYFGGIYVSESDTKGMLWLELTTGTFLCVNGNAVTNGLLSGDTSYSTASTSITFTAGGASFYLGTIRVWGVK